MPCSAFDGCSDTFFVRDFAFSAVFCNFVAMKALLITCLCLVAVLPARSQAMADLLRVMPDSIFPLLTLNDRLDLVDEWQGGVKAEVKNRLGGMVRLTELTDVRARLEMSAVSEVVLTLEQEPSGSEKRIRLTRICTSEGITDRRDEFYTVHWKRIDADEK